MNYVGPVPIAPTALMWTELVGPDVVPAIGTISARKVFFFLFSSYFMHSFMIMS